MTESKITKLIPPYGGLVNLVAVSEEAAALKRHAATLPSLRISERAVCDLEMLAIGALSPLDRFMGSADYARVLQEMRLDSGVLFPIPITLPVEADSVQLDQEITLCNGKSEPLAVMRVDEIYEWDWKEAAQNLLGSVDRHPLIGEMQTWGRVNISGPVRVFQLPQHHDFNTLRLTPLQTRSRLESLKKENVLTFQTQNLLNRTHEESLRRIAAEIDGGVLLHALVGLTPPGDADLFARVRSCLAFAEQWKGRAPVLMSLMPMAARMAGSREALWQAIIGRNYGASHFVFDRDTAVPRFDSRGKLQCACETVQLFDAHAAELGVKLVNFREAGALSDLGRDAESSKVSFGSHMDSFAGSYAPQQRGVCIWFTGFSGAGKSTTAEVLTSLLMEHGRQITLLDGDVVRTHLSKGLGFSKEDRDVNIRRIGFVANEIVRHGGVVICAAVSPYRTTRDDVRNMIGSEHFIETFVDTPLEVCEKRDAKGMYAKARRGEIKDFTGIDDPYEPPASPEIVLDTVSATPEANARRIVEYLISNGFIRSFDMTDRLSTAPTPVTISEMAAGRRAR